MKKAHDAIDLIRQFLKRQGVVANTEERTTHAALYITQRIWISVLYSGILSLAILFVAWRWTRAGCYPAFYAGLAIGLLGLTVRSWSFLNQGESPFPPYLITYPIIVLLGCPLIVHAAIHKFPTYTAGDIAFLTAAPCFVLGYGPMDFISKWK